MPIYTESQIVISPVLAETLGLEEATLISVLQSVMSMSDTDTFMSKTWASVRADKLLILCPFWRADDLRRIINSLVATGLVSVDGPPFGGQPTFRFCLESAGSKTAQPSAPPAGNPAVAANVTPLKPLGTKQSISGIWQPQNDTIRQLSQLGVDQQFALEQVPEFVRYWHDKNVSTYSWDARYIKHVWRRWQENQSSLAQARQETLMESGWSPSEDALDIMINKGGINQNFVQDAIPEFILYWKERGTRSSTWDSKFIFNVRRQWQILQGMAENDAMPRLMTEQWKPNEIVYDVLNLANIDRSFAESTIPEFVLYWQENGVPQSSWGTIFLKFVKAQWAYKKTGGSRNGQQQRYSTDSIRNQDFQQGLTDKSWV
jgi:hypothetical protein